jgi:Protein of unknown function (DUF3465)
MKLARILPALALVLAIWAWQEWPSRTGTTPAEHGAPANGAPADVDPSSSAGERRNSRFDAARESRPNDSTLFRSGERVETSGIVDRVLADDDDGSRHQRFIVKLASGQTLLIAHNIDIAPRVAGLTRGDTVSFAGIFEPNNKGGVVHWTHHDPSGRHASGWIEHNGQRYQ